MNEIKVRAWHTGLKRMFSPEEMARDQMALLPDGTGFWNIHGGSTKLSQRMDQMIPMQYIGIWDKSDAEIYAGDILRLLGESRLQSEGKRPLLKVISGLDEECPWKYTTGFYAVSLDTVKDVLDKEKQIHTCELLNCRYSPKLEVVSNIYEMDLDKYENKDLLE